MSEPTTEAGKALLADFLYHEPECMLAGAKVCSCGLRARLAAIEAETRVDERRELARFGPPRLVEQVVRDWLASPEAERRLAAALDQVWWGSPDAKDEHARAILAALRESQP